MVDGPFRIDRHEIIPSIEGIMPTEKVDRKNRERREEKDRNRHQEDREEKEEKKEEHRVDILA